MPPDPTTGSIGGGAAELRTGSRGRKGGLWLGLAGAALAVFGLGLYLKLNGTVPDSPATGEPGTGAQPGVTAAAASDAASKPVSATGGKAEALLQEAQAALQNRDWALASLKAREVQGLAGADPAIMQSAQQVIDRAAAEETAKSHSEALQQAAERQDHAKLREHFAAIDTQSVYHEDARATHDRVRDAYVEKVTAQAESLAEARKCDEVRKLQAEVQASWPEVANEQVGEILKACRPRTGAQLGSTGVGGESGLGGSGSIGGGSGLGGAGSTGGQRAPTKSFEELVTEAEEAASKGLFGQARRLCMQALRLKPSDDRANMICAIVACNLNNPTSAQRYYDHAGKEQKNQIYQICRSKGIDVRR